GGGPRDQDPLVSAQRELREETGITAGRWDRILNTHLSNSVTDELSFPYLARDLKFDTAEPEPTEQLQVKRVSLDEALERIDRGEITDALTILSLDRVKLLLPELAS